MWVTRETARKTWFDRNMKTTTVDPLVIEDEQILGAEFARKDLTALDRCDACGARAWVRAVMKTSELYFCGHHASKHLDALAEQALFVQDDRHLRLTEG